MRAAVYARQSRGKVKSIDDQLDLCRKAVAEHGWTPAGEYDDKVSASRYGRRARDGWPALLNAIERGQLDVVVMWESSRGDRTLESWARFLEMGRRRALKVHVISDRTTYDLSNDRHWQQLAEDGVDNAVESDKIRKRAIRGLTDSARRGRPAQGRCPYGYRRVYDPATGKLTGQEKDPDTAPVVAGILGDVAAGEPISRITEALNTAGVPAARGGRWTRQSVYQVARNPVYAAERRWRGETYAGGWPHLVEPATFYAAQRVLDDPGRMTTKPGKARHLLSYLAACDVCEAGFTAVRGRYRCSERGCVTIVQAQADAFVTAVIVARLSQPDVYERLRQAGDDVDKVVEQERAAATVKRTRLDEIRRAVISGDMSVTLGGQAEKILLSEIESHERRALEADVPLALRGLVEVGADVRERWEAMGVAGQRFVIRRLAEIRVAPVGGGYRFHPERFGSSRWVGDTLTWAQLYVTGRDTT